MFEESFLRIHSLSIGLPLRNSGDDSRIHNRLFVHCHRSRAHCCQLPLLQALVWNSEFTPFVKQTFGQFVEMVEILYVKVPGTKYEIEMTFYDFIRDLPSVDALRCLPLC